MVYVYLYYNSYCECVFCVLCIEDDTYKVVFMYHYCFVTPIFRVGFVFHFFILGMLTIIRLTVKLSIIKPVLYWNEYHQGDYNNP